MSWLNVTAACDPEVEPMPRAVRTGKILMPEWCQNGPGHASFFRVALPSNHTANRLRFLLLHAMAGLDCFKCVSQVVGGCGRALFARFDIQVINPPSIDDPAVLANYHGFRSDRGSHPSRQLVTGIKQDHRTQRILSC